MNKNSKRTGGSQKIPVSGKPVSGKPASGKPVSGKPASGKPVRGKPDGAVAEKSVGTVQPVDPDAEKSRDQGALHLSGSCPENPMTDTPVSSTGEITERPIATLNNKRKVELCLAAGMSEDRVAHILGISQQALRENFQLELMHANDKLVAENLVRLDRAAKGGNVAAQKYLDQKYRVASADDDVRTPAAVVGKKQQEQNAADAMTDDDLQPIGTVVKFTPNAG